MSCLQQLHTASLFGSPVTPEATAMCSDTFVTEDGLRGKEEKPYQRQRPDSAVVTDAALLHCVLPGGPKVTPRKLFQHFGCAAVLQNRANFTETQSLWARYCSLGRGCQSAASLNLLSLQSPWKGAQFANRHIFSLLTGSSHSLRDTAHGYAFPKLQIYFHVSFFAAAATAHKALVPSPGDAAVVPAQLCCRSLQTYKQTTCPTAPCSLLLFALWPPGSQRGKNTILRVTVSLLKLALI